MTAALKPSAEHLTPVTKGKEAQALPGAPAGLMTQGPHLRNGVVS